MTPLEYLKSIDRPELLALITKDDDAKKVLLAWTCAATVPQNPKKGAKSSQGRLREAVYEAWAEYPVRSAPFEEMAIISGVPKTTTKLKWDQLRKAGLIFPDGTARESAMSYVKSGIAYHLRGIGVK